VVGVSVTNFVKISTLVQELKQCYRDKMVIPYTDVFRFKEESRLKMYLLFFS